MGKVCRRHGQVEFDHVGFIAEHADFRELYAVLCHVIMCVMMNISL